MVFKKDLERQRCERVHSYWGNMREMCFMTIRRRGILGTWDAGRLDKRNETDKVGSEGQRKMLWSSQPSGMHKSRPEKGFNVI